MNDRVTVSSLLVSKPLHDLVLDAATGAGIGPDAFWSAFADVLARFTPRNRQLLAVRDELQARIDALKA